MLKLLFLSAGLGNISRGFEISAAAWFEQVKAGTALDAHLCTGGTYPGCRRVWNLPRNGLVCRVLRRLQLIQDGCRLEQVSFAFGLLYYLLVYKPDIIWLQEGSLAQWLVRFRKLFRFKYKVLFCDGAPLGHRFASQFDGAIFLHQPAWEAAIADGMDPARCLVQPHLVFQPSRQVSKTAARAQFGLEPADFVIICVAAWNKYHKRIDYLLQELAEVKGAQPVLLLCGQPEQETGALRQMAADLGLRVHWHTLSQQQLSVAYRAADVFILPSLSEGFGTVIIEAAMHALPVISHPHPGARYILGADYPGLHNLSEKGTLAAAVQQVRFSNLQALGAETEARVKSRFDTQESISNFTRFAQQIAAAPGATFS